MAKAVIKDALSGLLQKISDKSTRNVKILFSDRKTVVTDLRGFTDNIKTKNYPIAKINEGDRKAEVSFTLPFRVNFISTTIPGTGQSNVPPIGIAIIGVNNYIL